MTTGARGLRMVRIDPLYGEGATKLMNDMYAVLHDAVAGGQLMTADVMSTFAQLLANAGLHLALRLPTTEAVNAAAQHPPTESLPEEDTKAVLETVLYAIETGALRTPASTMILAGTLLQQHVSGALSATQGRG